MWKDSTGSTTAKMSVQAGVRLFTPRYFCCDDEPRRLLIIFARDNSYSGHYFIPSNKLSDFQPHGKALRKKDSQRVRQL